MKKNIKNKNYSGFTFVELIAVIAIIGIMTAVAIVSMNPNKTEAKLKAAQTEVASSIKQAQSYALQGKEQDGVTPQYYGIKFIDSANYGLYCACDNGSICETSGVCDNPVEAYQLKDGVTLSNNPLPAIFFSIPHGNSGLTTSLILTFELGSDAVKTITISSSGSILEN